MKKERSKKILSIFYKNFIPTRFKFRLKMTFDSFYDNVPKYSDLILFFFANLISWIIFYFITFQRKNLAYISFHKVSKTTLKESAKTLFSIITANGSSSCKEIKETLLL